MLRIDVTQIVAYQLSVFDADSPHLHDGTGKAYLGGFRFSEATGHIGWFDPENTIDPWSICEALVRQGWAERQFRGPSTYGHVDYYVTVSFLQKQEQDEAEAEYYARQAAAEIAAETNIPQHLVW